MTVVQEIQSVVVMTKDELIEKIDKAINELVVDKYDLQKAYNYYNGIRDADLFRYLEEVYGTNTPTTLQFTPLIKKHIDALIGEYMGMSIDPKIYCKDKDTITNIERDKQLLIAKEILKFLKEHLRNQVLNIINGKPIEDLLVALLIKQIKDDINTTFLSDYEIAALNVIEFVKLSRTTDFTNVLRDLILDLLITGYTYYKVYPTPEKDSIRIKALSPLNTFSDKNYDSPYVKNSQRVVVRRWLSKVLILNEFGKELSKEDIKLLEDKWDTIYDNAIYYVKVRNNGHFRNGIDSTHEVTPGFPEQSYGYTKEFIPVYEVEWVETDSDFMMRRYSNIRIGEEIYILRGEDTNVFRSKSNPSYCGLSVNGIYFLNRGNKPYSMVLACTHLLDLYDLLHFYRDNLIANSGTVGDWIDLALIPKELGVDLPERLVKWISLKKLGIAPLDSSQEGRLASGQAPLNTIFNGYDDTVKAQAIQAILIAIDSIELTVSSITGVFKERLNLIEQKDAVTNVKQGVQNSFIITKLYYHLMDLVVNELLLDCLNEAKVVFKNGLTGTLILGDKYQKVFTARPEHFTLTDFDIRIGTTSDVYKDLEVIRSLVPEFVRSGGLPPDIIVEAVTSKSVPDLKRKIERAMKILKEENNLMKLLSELLILTQNQLKLASSELQKALQEILKLNEIKLQMELKEMQMKYEVEQFKADTERTYREALIAELKRRTEIELAQLHDGNPYNDKIRALI